MNNIFTKTSTTITGAAVLIGGASLLSRVLGLIRDRIFAHLYGAGSTLDAYYAAFKIPDLLFNLIILGALSAGFIPVFIKYKSKNGLDKSWQIVETLLTYTIIALVLCGILLFIFASPLMRIITPGFNEINRQLAVKFTRVMFLSPILLGMSAILGSVLQSLRRFFIFALAPILYNIGIIFGAVVLTRYFGSTGLAYGVILGALMHFLIQFVAVSYAGFKPKISLKLTEEIRRILYLMLPRAFGIAISQISLIVLTAFASMLATGSISAFQFAHNIAFVPIGIFAVSYAVSAFPALSESAQLKNHKEFTLLFSSTVRQILFLLIPSTVIFLVLRAQIVRVLLGSGQFNWEDTVTTFDTLAMFALGFVAIGLAQLLVRGFYAHEDTKTPVFVSLISESIVIASAYFASRAIGVKGIALGISIGALVQVSLLWTLLFSYAKNLDGIRIVQSLFKMTIAAFGMAIIMQALKTPISNLVDMTTGIGILTQTLIVSVFGIIAYIFIGLIMRCHEMYVFVRAVREKLIKLAHLPNDMNDASSS